MKRWDQDMITVHRGFKSVSSNLEPKRLYPNDYDYKSDSPQFLYMREIFNYRQLSATKKKFWWGWSLPECAVGVYC